jgi:hypothetical protein
MQGCGLGKNSTWARSAAAINGTTETRTLKRNMERHSLNRGPETHGALWFVERKENSLPPG